MPSKNSTLVGRTARADIADGLGGLFKSQQVEIVGTHVSGGEMQASLLVIEADSKAKGRVYQQPATWLRQIDTNPPKD